MGVSVNNAEKLVSEDYVSNAIGVRMKVLCINVGYPGVSAVFSNMQNIGLCDYMLVSEIKAPERLDYDLAIFGAYHEKYLELMPLIKAKKAILITSSLGQIEQSPNYVELDQLNKIIQLHNEKKIDYILIGSQNLYESIKGTDIYHFPYPLNYEELGIPKVSRYDIGMFMPSAPRKNILNQIHAFRMSSIEFPELTLHTNVNIKTPGNMARYDWLMPDNYKSVIGSMYLTLHVSHVESFCYAVAEAIMLGTIPIISPCIRTNLDLPEIIMVKNPDSAIEISQKINQLVSYNYDQYIELLNCSRDLLKNLAKGNNKELGLLMFMLCEKEVK